MNRFLRNIISFAFVIVTSVSLNAEESDPVAVFNQMKERAAKGDAEAMYQVGVAYHFGRGVEKNMNEAIDWYKKGAHKGNVKAMATYGALISRGFALGSDKDAFKWIEKAAKKDYDFAQYNLGYCYKSGLGVERDYEKAYEYFQKAADQGNVAAQNSVGIAFLKGEGVPMDYEKAFGYFLKSAENGNPAAFNNVARCYALGQGTPENPIEAMKWYEKSAMSNDAVAQFLCGAIYYKGESRMFTGLTAPLDYDKAVRYFQMVLDNKRTTDDVRGESYRMLGACYRFGRGVVADEAEADRLTQLAAKYGDLDSKKLIEWYNNAK